MACVVGLRHARQGGSVRASTARLVLLPGRLEGFFIVMSFILIVADIVKPISPRSIIAQLLDKECGEGSEPDHVGGARGKGAAG